jgi:non-specific serine/threonine protein kinase
MLGMVAVGQADYARGADILEEGLRIARDEEAAAAWVSPILQNLARAAIGLGHIDQAMKLCAENREIAEQRNDTHGLEAVERLTMRLARMRGDVVQGDALTRTNLIRNRDLGALGNVATDFESLAWLARVAGDHLRAVRILGAADALRESIRRPIQAEVRRERDEDLSLTREALGDAAFETAFAEGRALTLERAIAYALEESSPP